MSLGAVYDAINAAIFLTAGGSSRVRGALVDALGVRAGDRVLEIGCGTGQVTARLLAAGAEVVALDALPRMLEAARRRAPRATFIEGDALEAELGSGYQHVVLSFVLHNFDAGGRAQLLARAAAAVSPGGQVGVLDWALPAGRVRALLWRRFLGLLEPASDNVEALLAGALDQDLPAAGLAIVRGRSVAGGRAEILIAAPNR